MAVLRGGGGPCIHKHQKSHSQITTCGYPLPVFNTISSSLDLNYHQRAMPWSGSSINAPGQEAMRTSRCPLLAMGAIKAQDSQAQMPEQQVVSYELLRQRLALGRWELADEETRRLLLVLAGSAAIERNYIFFSEVQFIPASDLKAIDELWRSHSNNRFGYSVQRSIWKKVDEDFTEFFKKVGWMKRLKESSEMDQYMYTSFPSEFMWELGESTPKGHLPLTNALRGTRLLSGILQHTAFDFVDNEEYDDRIEKRPELGFIFGAVPQFQNGVPHFFSSGEKPSLTCPPIK